jgi:hypothetical protein
MMIHLNDYMAFSGDFPCYGSTVIVEFCWNDASFLITRKDGYHFWGGQKQCLRGAYVAELAGRELTEELGEIANFAALSLGLSCWWQGILPRQWPIGNLVERSGRVKTKCMVSYWPYLAIGLACGKPNLGFLKDLIPSTSILTQGVWVKGQI